MELIKIFENSLTNNICNKIIDIFESQENKNDGMTNAGLNKNVKNSTDLHSVDITNSNWIQIEKLIRKELNIKLEFYYYEINIENVFFEPYYYIEDSGFQIQKYNINEGFYKYHNDFNIIEPNKFRVLTYIWYLNDIEEGGETEFYNGLKIKPKAGKLLIFPSTWTYTHKGNIPISNNKFIMTGWIYCKF